ncbi:unnamed protein product [Anisakis simplex]|uniref:NUC153 domain-containing protein n=1 Tax=Anisakis simplex TaxID=6269 RepID=A0A0M3KKC1_ANISI|nr:unnamed protein product [Anisakis simplex]
MKALENVDGDEKRNKKKAKIDAFGGLVGLEQYSDDDHDDVEKRKEKANKAINYKNGLLSALPQPKSKSRIESKGANVLLPNSVRARKKIKKQEVSCNVYLPK